MKLFSVLAVALSAVLGLTSPVWSDVTMAVTQAAANTATGNQTFTASNFGGGTPKAALFSMTRATAVDTTTTEAKMSFGAAISTTNRWAYGGQIEDGTPNADSDNFTSTTSVIRALAVNGTEEARADFVSFGVNNVTINWSDAPPEARLVTVVLFGGSDLTVDAGQYSIANGAQDSSISITGLNSSARKVIIHTSTSDNNSDSIDTSFRLSIGFAYWDGSTITQSNNVSTDQNGASVAEPSGFVATDRVWTSLETGGTVSYTVEATNFAATSFDFTIRDAVGQNDDNAYLVLNIPNTQDASILQIDTPTSTGNQAYTGSGHEAIGVLLLENYLETRDIAITNSQAGPWGWGAFTTDDEASVEISQEDGVTNPNTDSRVSASNAASVDEGDLSSQVIANFVSMNSDGFTLNYSSVDTTAKRWVALTFGTVAVPPSAGTFGVIGGGGIGGRGIISDN